jgi:hypothetical protein
MKCCPYCASELRNDSNRVMYEPFYICDFCQLEDVEPVEQGKRRSQYTRKQFVELSDADLSTPHLMEFHTFDLLMLLKLLREERRAHFNYIRTFKMAGNETEDFRDIERETGDEYERITRKVWVVENILIDRIGYIPQRVSNELLGTVLDRIEQTTKKAMIINKGENKQIV